MRPRNVLRRFFCGCCSLSGCRRAWLVDSSTAEAWEVSQVLGECGWQPGELIEPEIGEDFVVDFFHDGFTFAAEEWETAEQSEGGEGTVEEGPEGVGKGGADAVEEGVFIGGGLVGVGGWRFYCEKNILDSNSTGC
jgi:hypothetical protein